VRCKWVFLFHFWSALMFKSSLSTWRLPAAFALSVLLLAACGDDTPEGEVCPAIAGEQHLAIADSSPSALPLMIHILNRECPIVGPNVFRIYHMNAMHAPTPTLNSAGDGLETMGLVLHQVKAFMPSHGHGTAVPEMISADTLNEFSVTFQMPGAWQIDVEFTFPSITTVVQTASFAVYVH
jgi:hypothetical protein